MYQMADYYKILNMANYCGVWTCAAESKRDGVNLFSFPPSMSKRMNWIKISIGLFSQLEKEQINFEILKFSQNDAIF